MRSLTASFWDYDRTRPLVDKRIIVDGYELCIEINRPEIIFARAFADAPYDVCEISFSNSVTAASLDRLQYTLIPVFLSRAFRHSSLFIRTDRGIRSPEDLKGKIVGLQEYDMTAAVVVRGFLRDQYGVDSSEIMWKVGELERTKPLEFPLGNPPDGVSIEYLRPDKSLEDRLVSGELDAIISLRPLASAHLPNACVAALFPDAVAAEADWYRSSKHFPIMHAVGVRKTILGADPALGRRLFDAFLAAKQIAISELEVTQAQKVTLPWPHGALAQARAIFGIDHWPYGVAANRLVIENQLRRSWQDGLQKKPVQLETLFDSGCLDT
jgi:4,5-dihydroxyphthalate decarboxylase